MTAFVNRLVKKVAGRTATPLWIYSEGGLKPAYGGSVDLSQPTGLVHVCVVIPVYKCLQVASLVFASFLFDSSIMLNQNSPYSQTVPGLQSGV